MRMRLSQYVQRRACADELVQHLAAEMARVLDPAVQLAVGKGARPALAELRVGFLGQHAAPP